VRERPTDAASLVRRIVVGLGRPMFTRHAGQVITDLTHRAGRERRAGGFTRARESEVLRSDAMPDIIGRGGILDRSQRPMVPLASADRECAWVVPIGPPPRSRA
jgi:hypothetical protein